MASSYTTTRRGFKIHNTRKLSVHRLRARIVCFFRMITRWRKQTLTGIKRGICREDGMVRDRLQSCRKGVVERDRKTFARSNSFYTEAIKECLEFIKRTSLENFTEEEEEEDEDHGIRNQTSSSRLINRGITS